MKLKPCPFCGGRATAAYAEHSNIPYKISCSTKGCFMYHWRNYYKEKDAQSVEKWNTRAEEPAEQKTAHWDINCDGYYPFCSHCGEATQHMSPYCPNCGRKMITRGHDDT